MSTEVEMEAVVVENNENIENISEPTEEFLENSSFNYWNMDGSEYSFNTKTGEIFMKVNDEWVLNCKTVQPNEIDMTNIQMNNFLLGQHINCLYTEITRLYNMEINPLKSALNHANWTIRNFIRDRNNGNYSSLMNTIHKYKSQNNELKEETSKLKEELFKLKSTKQTDNQVNQLKDQIRLKNIDLKSKCEELELKQQEFNDLKTSFEKSVLDNNKIINDLNNQLNLLNQSKIDELHDLKNKNKNLLDQINILNEQLDYRKSNINSENTNLTKRINQLENEKNSLKTDKTRLENELIESKEELKKVQSNIGKKDKDFKKLKSEYDLLLSKFNELETEYQLIKAHQTTFEESAKIWVKELNSKLEEKDHQIKCLSNFESLWNSGKEYMKKITREKKELETCYDALVIQFSGQSRAYDEKCHSLAEQCKDYESVARESFAKLREAKNRENTLREHLNRTLDYLKQVKNKLKQYESDDEFETEKVSDNEDTDSEKSELDDE